MKKSFKFLIVAGIYLAIINESAIAQDMQYHQIEKTNLEFVLPSTFTFVDGVFKSVKYNANLFFVAVDSKGAKKDFGGRTIYEHQKEVLVSRKLTTKLNATDLILARNELMPGYLLTEFLGFIMSDNYLVYYTCPFETDKDVKALEDILAESLSTVREIVD